MASRVLEHQYTQSRVEILKEYYETGTLKMISFKEYLEEAADKSKLKELIKKHSLNANNTASKIDSFNYTKEIENDFKNSGYELRYHAKTDKFHVMSFADKEKKEKQSNDHEAAKIIRGGRWAISRK